MTDRWTEFDWAPDLDGPERDEIDGWSALSTVERAEIERLNLEVVGLMPFLLEPIEPSASVKGEILARAARSKLASFPARAARPARRRWLLPLAAALAIAALGVAASLYTTVRDERRELAALEARVEELTRDSMELAAIRDGLESARQNLQLVSSQGVEICPLRPTEGPAKDRPYGLLFVAADHQHWYVRVTGLDADPERYYRLWFETADGSLVSAGNLLGQELELSSPTMPEGTRAVHVSVETDPEPSAPSGEFVLFGNDMIRVS